jgi:hypothetical protein
MNPEPTHDADRDISGATEGKFSYDLAANENRPQVVATNPMRRAGHGGAEKEEQSLIGGGNNALILARSGNQSWDADEYDAVGGVEDESVGAEPAFNAPSSPNYDPGMPVAKVLVIAAAVAGLWFLWKETRHRTR